MGYWLPLLSIMPQVLEQRKVRAWRRQNSMKVGVGRSAVYEIVKNAETNSMFVDKVDAGPGP